MSKVSTRLMPALRPGLVLLMATCSLIACSPDQSDPPGTDWLGDWRVLGDELPLGAINSAWGNDATGEQRRWVLAGGKSGNAVIYTLKGATWQRHDFPGQGMLWWTHGDSQGRRVAVGDNGLILRWQDGDDSIDAVQIPELATESTALYGVWFGDGADHFWLVGGTPTDGGKPGPLWRVSFSSQPGGEGADALKEPLDGKQGVLSKIWSADGERLWAVGDRGRIWSNPDGKWQIEYETGPGRVVGVSGRKGHDVVAVGGQGAGIVLRRRAATWKLSAGGPTSFVNGLAAVMVMPDGTSVVGGTNGYIATEDGADHGGELPALDPPITDLALHGAFAGKHTHCICGGTFGSANPVGTVLMRGAALPPLPN